MIASIAASGLISLLDYLAASTAALALALAAALRPIKSPATAISLRSRKRQTADQPQPSPHPVLHCFALKHKKLQNGMISIHHELMKRVQPFFMGELLSQKTHCASGFSTRTIHTIEH